MKIIFIGDAHLRGLADPNQKRLVKFLDGLGDVDTLVLLGDVFDFWTGFKGVVYWQYVPVLNSLIRLRESGVHIIYLEGNHDFAMGEFFKGVLGASVFPNSVETELDGMKVYLAHGDVIAGGFGHALWRHFLRSAVFRLAARATGEQFVWNTAMRMSTKSRAYNKGCEKIEAKLKAYALWKIKNGARAVILGHSHVAGVHKEKAAGKTAVYANPGSWVNNGSYLLYEEGEFRVKKYGG